MTADRPTGSSESQPRLGKGLRMVSVVLASALAAVVTHLVVAAVADGLEAPGPSGEAQALAAGASLAVGAIVAGAAMMLAALLLPRVTHAIRVTQWIGVAVLALSLVPIGLAWGDLASPAGLVVLHVVVGIVVVVGLDWAMDDAATIDA